MVFYFSGTGNSKGIAEIIAQRLNDREVDIVNADPAEFRFKDGEYLGFVFPIYAWAAPELVLKFAERLDPGETFTFAVATYSNVAGLALEQFSKILPLNSGYGITMPDNFPVLEKILETEESSLQKLSAAKVRLEEVIERLLTKEEVFDVLIGDDSENRTYKLADYFNEHQRSTAPYRVEEDRCTGCALCKTLCPASAIEMKDEKPVWVKESCYLCMACFNFCPTEAIEFGEHSKGRFRYYFKGFDTSQYFN